MKLTPLLLLGILPAASCLDLSKDYVEKRQYVLEVARPDGQPAERPRADAVLTVRPFTADPGFDGPGLIYQRGEARYEADFYNEFLEPPTAFVRACVREWIRDARLFGAVVEPGALAEADYVIDGCLTRLVGDYREDPVALVALQLFLTRYGERGAEVCLHRDYSRSEPVSQKDPEALLAAYRRALEDILTDWEGDVSEYLLGLD